jgi:tagatose 6-phosphate kinase
MVVTLTLNPMIDKTVTVDRIRMGGTTRAASLTMTVGGKGINVARQLKQLGQEVNAVTSAGGETGWLIKDYLTREDLPHTITKIQARTREGVTYRDDAGLTTAVFEPSQKMTADEVMNVVDVVKELIATKTITWLICSGSAPCSSADNVYASLLAFARSRNVATALDAYGPVFRNAMKQSPSLVHVNREEARELPGPQRRSDSDLGGIVLDILHAGVEYAIVTNGEAPFFGGWNNSVWRVVPPRVVPVNPVGSGDSLVAATIHGLLQGWDWGRCLAFGAAAGAANASVWEVASSSPEAINTLVPRVVVEKVT